jgi:crotonobetaine/carnitine-CoA ligase
MSAAKLAIEREFSARACIRRAREVGATLLVGSGAIGTALLSLPESRDDRDHPIETMMIVPLPEQVQNHLRDRYGCDVWTEGFGQTECTPISIAPRLSPRRDRGGCGLPAVDLDVALLDDDRRMVPAGDIGEICLRPRDPRAMFDGYLDDDGHTVLDPLEDGWYRTGDFARQRDSGQLMFVDRKKDALRRRGENVSSMELEAAIARHPAVAAVAVHAVPSNQTEDDIKACIVPVAGASLEAASLFEYLSARVPYFAVPRYVELLDSLPTNAVGRVMKHLLRNRPASDRTWDFEALGLVVPRADRRTIKPPPGR